jgi:hypothetical protein
MPVSEVVDRAAQAVIEADKHPQTSVPESAEVAAAPKAAASKKYDDATKKAAKRAEALRGKARSVGPVQVERVKSALGKTKPEDVVKAFKSQKDAIAFAGGDQGVTQPDLVKDISSTLADAFCRGRGLTAICLALAGK